MNNQWYIEEVCHIVFLELSVVTVLSVSHLVAFIRVIDTDVWMSNFYVTVNNLISCNFWNISTQNDTQNKSLIIKSDTGYILKVLNDTFLIE